PERARTNAPPLLSVPHASPPQEPQLTGRNLGRRACGFVTLLRDERRKFPRTSDQERSDSLPRVVRVPVPLAAEIALARAAGRLSRLARAGGGTTVPGKLLWKLDPGAVDRLAARLPLGSALISATHGKSTTAAIAAEILGG